MCEEENVSCCHQIASEYLYIKARVTGRYMTSGADRTHAMRCNFAREHLFTTYGRPVRAADPAGSRLRDVRCHDVACLPKRRRLGRDVLVGTLCRYIRDQARAQLRGRECRMGNVPRRAERLVACTVVRACMCTSGHSLQDLQAEVREL